MLRFFRGGGVAKGLVGAIVAAIIVVFVMEFRAGRGPSGGLSRQCAVKYAGNCLDQKDYYAAWGLAVPRGVQPKAIKQLGLRRKVLDGLAERELLVEQARALGLGISKDAVETELEAGRARVSLPAADARALSAQLGLCRLDASGAGCEPGTDQMIRQLRVSRTPGEPFDYAMYEREIRINANRGPREFREMQERELLAARLRHLVRSRVRVSEQEAAFVAQRAVIRSALIDRDWFAKYVIDASEPAVERWTFEHRAQVDAAFEADKGNFTPGCPLVREIVTALPPFSLDDEKDPARQAAEQARARVRAGEDFGAVARELSSAPSAMLGGALGCVTKNSGVGAEELLVAAEKLKPGEISEPIETPRGYHVIEVLGRLTEKDAESRARQHLALGLYASFAADEAASAFAQGLIRSVKAGQKLEDAITVATEDVLGKAPRKPSNPRAAAANQPASPLVAADRPRFEVSAPFSRSGNPLPEVEPKEALAPKAFELSKADALYEKPIETTTGFVVMQLKELTQPDDSKKELEEVRQALLQMKADHAVARYVSDLRRAAGKKLNVDLSFAEDRTRSDDEQ